MIGTGRLPKRAGAGQEPSREESLAAQQVVDLFATEVLLALDRYERSLPAADQARRTADRLAYWWSKIGSDDVRLDRAGTDAEQILAKSLELALDRDNDWGLSLDEATALATNEAVIMGRRVPTKGVADFRREFEDAYGGEAGEPSHDDTWLAQSLTRFARASLLRDVVEAGAKVRVSEPLREAADVMVTQGRRLTDHRLDLARSHDRPIDKRALRSRQADTSAKYALLSLTVDVASLGSPVVDVALKVPVILMYAAEMTRLKRTHKAEVATRHDPARTQLRFDRQDAAITLDSPPPATRRDLRAIRNATTRRTGPER